MRATRRVGVRRWNRLRAGRFALHRLALIALAAALIGACGTTVPPALKLETQPAHTADLYRFVAAHQALAEQVTCYCGCGDTLEHRHLRDCFVRDDGSFDPHGAGCGICQAEAGIVMQLDGQQQRAPAIAAAIDQQFGQAGPPTRARQEKR